MEIGKKTCTWSAVISGGGQKVLFGGGIRSLARNYDARKTAISGGSRCVTKCKLVLLELICDHNVRDETCCIHDIRH